MSQAFFQIAVRAPDAARAERLLAEAYAAGATGCEERASGSGTWWLLYVAGDRAAAVAEALRAAAEALHAAGVDSEIGAPEPVSDEDWTTRWREGLEALVISPRLVVRPPFVAHAPGPGQATVVIEPGQAFGTGEHESTRLALELVDAWLRRLADPQVLDVGTGSGVLAIAAVKLGASAAVALDLDPVASAAALENARANRVETRARILTGGIEAVAPGLFDLVVANLLRCEIEPILEAVVARVAPGGVVILTGLLEADGPALARGLAGCGLTIAEERRRTDSRGERWLGLVARRSVG